MKEYMISYISGYIVYPLIEKFSGRNILSKVKELRNFESLSRVQQVAQQRVYLYELLSHCQQHVPYYRSLFKAHSFDIEKVKTDVKWIEELPILTKEIIRDRTEHFKCTGGSTLHQRKTGGSTGQAVFFYYDDDALDWTAAINLRAYEISGKKPHHSDCHSGAELGFNPPPLRDKIKLFAQNRSILKVSSFSETGIMSAYDFLRRKKPFLLQAHPSTLVAIASYIEEKVLPPVQLCKVFEPSGEMLTEKSVKLIEKYILCDVFNRYGNAEFGVIAHSLSASSYNSLKVFDRAFYAESCKGSNIIVTSLTNFGFPLIRYDTGDLADVVNGKDGTFIENIQGRIHDLVTIADEVIPTHYIMDYLDHKVGGVREFQILIEKGKDPVLCIVVAEYGDKDHIEKSVLARWPRSLSVRFIDFDEVVRSGWRQKFRHLVELDGRKK